MNQALFVWFSLSVGCALGCSSGGQSFDDGSGDLGKRNHSDQGPPRPLSEQPSLRITSGPVEAGDLLDASVSFLGDLDADGLADFALMDGEQTAYVFYGRTVFPSELPLADADFTIQGVNGPLTPVGDFNGDGSDDFAFLAIPGHAGGSLGQPTLLLGASERVSGSISAAELPARFTALVEPAAGAHGLMRPGDVNGDGLQDLVIASVGSSQLLLGTTERVVGPGLKLDLHMAQRELWDDAPGDLDGDGIDDLLAIGSQGTALYYGRGAWESSSEALRPDATFNGWMRGFGDWDGDGYGDLAQLVDRYTPEVDGQPRQVQHELVLSYGGPERFSGIIVPRRPPADTMYGYDAKFARGDINGDQQPDLILGSAQSRSSEEEPEDLWPHAAGAVFYERAPRTRADELSFGDSNIAFRGRDGSSDLLGLSVSSGGDANGDGYQDLLILRNPTPDDPVEATLVFGGSGL